MAKEEVLKSLFVFMIQNLPHEMSSAETASQPKPSTKVDPNIEVEGKLAEKEAVVKEEGSKVCMDVSGWMGVEVLFYFPKDIYIFHR